MAFMNLNGLPTNDRGEVWSGNQMVGMIPGVGGSGGRDQIAQDMVGRDQIAQAMLAQQGMPPPQGPGPAYGGELALGGGGGQRIDFGGLDPNPSAGSGGGFAENPGFINPGSGGGGLAEDPGFIRPGGGGGGRQQIGGGWSTEGNNVYDPFGSLVGSHGLQQYGHIPGVTPGMAGGGGAIGLANPYTGGSSLSGGKASGAGSGELGPTGAGNTVGQVNPFSEGAATGRFGFGETANSPFGGRGGGQEGFGLALSTGGRGGGSTPNTSGLALSESQTANPVTTTSFTQNSPSFPGGPFAGRGGKEGEGFGTFAQTGVVPGAAVNALGQIIDTGKAYAGGLWDMMTGQPLNEQAIQAGPNPNAPGANAPGAGSGGGFNTASDFALSAPGFTGFGGFSGGSGGGWGDTGFAGSGFNSSGSYSGGYDTAAGNVG